MLVIENCNSLSELRQKLIDGEEVRTVRQEPCKVSEYDKDHIWYKGNQYISLRRFLEVKAEAEKEPCEDAISRQAAIDAMYDLCDTGGTLEENPWRDNPHIDAVTDALDNLPPVNPQPKTEHWIPVSEKLPDKEGYYLCSVRYMYPPYNFFEPEKVKYMDDVTIQKFDGEFNIEVKAWMPLLEPYEAESEDK